MSLIVQVNNSGAAQPPQQAAASQQNSNNVAATPTVQVVATSSEATPPPPVPVMQNSLATLVAAAEQQQKKLQSVGIPHHAGGHTPTTITRITTNLSPHMVQHHPPPLRMVQLSGPSNPTVVTTVALPQAPAPVPIRHALPQSPVGRPPQLPRSPVRQHQLPTTPLQRSLVQQGGIRTNAIAVTNGGQQCIMVNPGQGRANHLSMLPQNPSPGIMPSAATVQSLLPQNPSTLVPLPAHAAQHQHRIQHTVAAVNSTTTILPPTLLNRQLFSRSGLPNESVDGHLRHRLEMGVDANSPAVVQRGPMVGRHVAPSSRQHHQQRDRRSLPCQLALQDHNYVSKLPPTPSPPPPQQAPSIMQVEATKRQPNLPQHPNPSFNSANLRGLVPEFPPSRNAMQQSPMTSPTNNRPAQASPPGLLAAVTGQPGSNATAGEPIGTSVLPSRVQANLNSIEEAGVGPMAPLVEDDNSRLSNSSTDEQERGGEETETAPEGEPEDDSITRCICDYLHDDGYMICCDKCLVWQHVVCMGLDKNNIPDEYLCEVCKPRPIDRKRAKALQTRRRTELFKDSSSSDGDANDKRHPHKKQPLRPTPASSTTLLNANNKKMLDRKAAAAFVAGKKQKLKKAGTSLLDKVKKQYKKRKSATDAIIHKNKSQISPKKSAIARRKSTTFNDSDLDSDVENNIKDEDADLEPNVEQSQSLRSWIDQYEEAVTNHYSPELRARLSRLSASVGSDLRPSAIGGPTRCNVSLKGNGVKILTAVADLKSNTPLIECKGRIMLASQYRSSNKVKADSSYVFFYSMGDLLEICLDGKTYGNDGRFCRRSAASHNAELRHVIDKGSLHLFIVATKSIAKNEEVLLPPDGNQLEPLPSINADLREIKKPLNGQLLSVSSPEEAPLRDTIKKKEKKKVKVVLKGSSKNDTKKNGPNVRRKIKSEIKAEAIKTEVKKESTTSEEEMINSKPPPPPPALDSPPLNGKLEDIDLDDLDEEAKGSASPSKNKGQRETDSAKGSPSKLGLPDASGLIVGVNTINYDASSSVKNKAKSREERKMEMIMKAIEAMEKAEQRKKDNTDQPPTKRRRSSSSYRNDSNLDASSADESKPEPKRNRKKGRKMPTTPQRRRSRVMSGGSVSNMSADETPIAENNSSVAPLSSNSQNGPFRFPKTKKTMMSEWLHESESNSLHADDDDVSANYLKGSRSPPGISTHLLRSTAQSPVKNVCSAKKRWLRQAISEDHTDEVTVNGSASPLSSGEAGNGVMDMVTPLKKRRLANYKVDQEQEETIKVPNGLKKQFLQNLVLEAVLDKAMEDMLATPATQVGSNETKKDCVEPTTKATEPEKPKPDEGPSSTAESIKAPEPNSAFKSFFTSNVSLEALEAEIAASKKQRESTVVNLQSSDEAQFSPVQTTEVKAELETDIKKEEILSPKEDPLPEIPPQPVIPEKAKIKDEEVSKESEWEEKEQPQIQPAREESEVNLDKPKAKKRVSLADYKSLRRVSSSNSTPNTPSTPPVQMDLMPQKEILHSEEGPGTPTQDEHTSSLSTSNVSANLPPTLNTLPLFEKLDKLELAQQEIKRKASNLSLETPNTLNTRSPILEPKREDLTSRLQKEFGLLVDNDTNDEEDETEPEKEQETGGVVEGDATPEEDSPPPPPPAPSSRFLPSQIPSYTQNYPSPAPVSGSTPKKFSVPPPPPPPSSSHHHRSSDYNFPPPPPPPLSSSLVSGGAVPNSIVQPLPPPPPAPLPAMKASSSSNNSSRRPPSKDYYNRGSPGGGGGRGYYTSNSHRESSSSRGSSSSRDHHHHHHRDHRGDHRDQRDRDHRDRDYRSQSSRRNAYQSRSYY